jgi:hypothetical protein
MSGSTFAYGDRPIATIQGNNAYATFDFWQYLQKLSAAHNTAGPHAAATAVNTNQINALETKVGALTVGLAASVVGYNRQFDAMAPVQGAPAESAVVLDTGVAAVPLVSGMVSQIASVPTTFGKNLVVGMAYLTGAGTVTLATVSVGLTPGVVEAVPGAFANAWYGDAGASPATIGADLSLGNVIWVVAASKFSTAFLNVSAVFSGEISCYGGLIVLPYGS